MYEQKFENTIKKPHILLQTEMKSSCFLYNPNLVKLFRVLQFENKSKHIKIFLQPWLHQFLDCLQQLPCPRYITIFTAASSQEDQDSLGYGSKGDTDQEIVDLKTLRAIRVLRPLKLVSGVPSKLFLSSILFLQEDKTIFPVQHTKEQNNL